MEQTTSDYMDNNERYINPYTDFGFKKLFEQAEIAKYNSSERRQYEESQKEYWDYTSTLQTAEKKGRAEGRAKLNTAHNLKAMGVLSDEQIAAATGLTIDEIKSL
jgi:predicted transposase/invertase (TIGR01784 family)